MFSFLNTGVLYVYDFASLVSTSEAHLDNRGGDKDGLGAEDSSNGLVGSFSCQEREDDAFCATDVRR